MRGRKPTPTALKIDRGNPGRRPITHTEPELAPASAKVPARLKGLARREWIRLVDELISKGVLTVGDMYCFQQYCQVVGEIDDLEQLLRTADPAETLTRRYANHLLKLRTLCRQQATELGLTPSSRSRVKAVKVLKLSSQNGRFFGKPSDQ